MTEQLFRDAPSVELLQWLARGSLKQNLPRSVRLWAWLQFLYSNEQDRIATIDPFTYADCRDAFFAPTHPKGEEIPALHDPLCRCTLTTASWLFNHQTGLSEVEWRQSLEQHGSVPENLDELLQERLFGVTRRSLAADLKILAEMGWLTRLKHRYYRVQNWPNRAISGKNNLAPRLDGELEMTAILGGDFSRSAELMLLRFDQNYLRLYIEGKMRPEMFERVSYEGAANFIQQNAQPQDQQELLAILNARSPDDAYCRVSYRDGDPNVLLQISAWRPYVEVLFPKKLRQAIANDVLTEYQLYHRNPSSVKNK